jgi:hypothetical protein
MSMTNWQLRSLIDSFAGIARNIEKLAESASTTAKTHEKMVKSLETLIKMLKTD